MFPSSGNIIEKNAFYSQKILHKTFHKFWVEILHQCLSGGVGGGDEMTTSCLFLVPLDDVRVTSFWSMYNSRPGVLKILKSNFGLKSQI